MQEKPTTVERKIHQWAHKRKIFQQSTPKQQLQKTIEEIQELVQAVENNDYVATVDSIGDVAVTLVILAKMFKTTLYSCLKIAYNEIKNRQGFMENGVFVKIPNKTKEEKQEMIKLLCLLLDVPYPMPKRIQQTNLKNKYTLLIINAKYNGIRTNDLAKFFQCCHTRILDIIKSSYPIHQNYIIPTINELYNMIPNKPTFCFIAKHLHFTYREISKITNFSISKIASIINNYQVNEPIQNKIKELLKNYEVKPLKSLTIEELRQLVLTKNNVK